MWREFHPASERGFNVLTWNVLADGLAESGGFLHSPMEALQWTSRADLIVRQILSGEHSGHPPHVICLQEVDHFADSLEPALQKAGFSGAFVPKTEGWDGCCVFWNRERFGVRWIRPLRFVDESGANATQVALLVALIDKLDDRPLLVATSHLKAKAGFELQREHQAGQLRDALMAAAARLGPDTAVVLGGDFNDVPGSPAFEAMLKGGHLFSAYAAAGQGEDADWTTWKVRATGEVRRTIDYVFFGPHTLRPVAVLLPPEREAIDQDRLPSWRYPSDHLSLMVRFEKIPLLTFEPININANAELCVRFRADSFHVSFGTERPISQDPSETPMTLYPGGETPEEYLVWLGKRMQDLPGSCVHVLLAGEIVGQIEMGRFRLDPSIGYVNLFYLVPKFRGKGLGAQMDRFAADFLHRAGYQLARLSVSKTNFPALAFYSKHQWKDLGPRVDHPLAHYMEKQLMLCNSMQETD
jgi:mRNA deadenylase 3'-5' endonuclease subunit Ccr4/GNAT superfamily N-acetyltransferase